MWLLYASGFYIQLVFRTGLTVINKLLLYLYYQISPQQLVEQGLSLCRTVQPQGHFVVVFPQAFTSSVCCGYNIAESLHFATHDWIQHGCKAAKVSDRSSMTTKLSGSRRKYKYQCFNYYWLRLFQNAKSGTTQLVFPLALWDTISANVSKNDVTKKLLYEDLASVSV